MDPMELQQQVKMQVEQRNLYVFVNILKGSLDKTFVLAKSEAEARTAPGIGDELLEFVEQVVYV